ncbi:hypothetical protein [Kallotenue papyrolyticum]|uniref:hypothetical protein n=1 Tax=Kallotenue papyrolyticum TaxID=1325125 RepID=UPI00046FF43A|nr:hypothetical protein [Kallotenue papyrolyticum]
MSISTQQGAGEVVSGGDALLQRVVRIAPAMLRREQQHWVWMVHCPFCGEQHAHYAGPVGGDPYAWAGRIYAARCERTARRAWLSRQPVASLWYIIEAAAPRSSGDGELSGDQSTGILPNA